MATKKVTVVAPSTLDAGYTFEAQADGKTVSKDSHGRMAVMQTHALPVVLSPGCGVCVPSGYRASV